MTFRPVLEHPAHHHGRRAPEPRWPAALAALGAAGTSFAMPPEFSPGPSWLLPALVVLLLAGAIAAYRRGRPHLAQRMGYGVQSVLSLGIVWALVALVGGTIHHRQPPATLLVSAASLWASNVLVFASWYWRLDAGGPHARDSRDDHVRGALLFPQMTLSHEERCGWRPGFVDYLFVAFNTSTAFSPTDAPVLSRWAKALMMLQSTIALTTIAVLAARAVNIL